MADRDLGQRILRFLSLRTKPENAVKLAQALRVPKKALNSELYALAKAKKVVKVQDAPPMWGIAKDVSVFSLTEHEAAPAHRTRGKPSPLHNKSSVDEDLVENVLKHLQRSKMPVKALDIAKSVGLNAAADVNSTLYYLEKKNLVSKYDTKPPTWSLAHEGQSSDEGLEDEIQEMGTSRSEQEDVKPGTSNPMLSFQEISLFPSDDDSIDKCIVKVESNGSVGKTGSAQKSFREMFGLNDDNQAMSDSDSSNSFDIRANFLQNYKDEKDMDTTDVRTPPSADIDELDIVDVKEEETEFDDNDIVNLHGEARKLAPDTVKTEMEENLYDSAAVDCNEQDIPAEDIPEFDTSLSPEETKDCLNVITHLASLPGLTNFVLKKKSSLPDARLSTIMEKCVSLNYVSGSTKLWQISELGETLSKAHAGVSRKPSGDPFESVSLKRKLHTNSHGPPPSPMQLLKHQGSNSSTVSTATPASRPGNPAKLSKPSQPASYSSTASVSKPATMPSFSMGSLVKSFTIGQGSTQGTSSVNSNRASSASATKPTALMSLVPKQNMSSSTMAMSITPEQKDSNAGLFDGFMNVEASPTKSPVAVPKQPRVVANIPGYKKKDEEPPKVKITEEYMNYPNQKLTHDILKDIQRPSRKKNLPAEGKSAFHKAVPPSPMDILAKGLKRTDISPPEKKVSNRTSLSSTINSNPVSLTGSTSSNLMKEPRPLLPMAQLISQKTKKTGLKQSKSMASGLGQCKPMSLPSSTCTTSGAGSLQQSKSASDLLALSSESFAALNKSPVSALMEYAQSRKMEAKIEVVSQRGSSHKPMFEMAAFVGDRKFPSIKCYNKKEGRKEAADIAMRQLVAEGQFQPKVKGPVAKSQITEKMTHFDMVAALTHRGFTALVSQITGESFAGRKVVAGIVMKRSITDTGVLISIGTGNRCITGHHLSLQGNTVNDSHAEIIARRGFIRFLYKQLLEYDPFKPSPLFERLPNGKIRVKSTISFHLYISTAPCGDGALFSPRDADASKAPVDTRVRPPHNPTFSSPVHGLLRTKVEGGEGTIPVEADFEAQTFDGIQRGERLRTMSCTDKICRWNVVGMQGALLSHFLEPVYLDSLSLGLLFDQGHLSRAVCCRVGYGPTDVTELLPEGYRLNHPWLGRVTSCDPPREVQKTKALSINWSFGDTGPEVTDGTKGINYTSVERSLFSRCSKKNMFQSFKAVCEKFGNNELLEKTTYNEAKLAAKDFVIAKKAMLAKFKENRLGKWVSKPVEEEMFGF